MEYYVVIRDNSGISVASTYIEGDSKQEVIDDLREQLELAESGDSDWMDGAFDEE